MELRNKIAPTVEKIAVEENAKGVDFAVL